MMRYLAYAKKNFLSHSAYRIDHFIGIFNTCLKIFIFWCIYRALYGNQTEVDGISFSMVTTNFVIAQAMSAVFTMDEFYLPYRINSGSIGNELLKPISFKGVMVAENIGNAAFQLIFHFIPALIIAVVTVGVMKPESIGTLIGFTLSMVLGGAVLWSICFIFQTLAFWLINVWSLVTIKNVFVNVLSGSMIPIWFLPDWMQNVIRFTPFSSIYFTPIQIYLGRVKGTEMMLCFVSQLIWIVLLYLIGEFFWRKGLKKLVVQGG